jgi:hypothetical protein
VIASMRWSSVAILAACGGAAAPEPQRPIANVSTPAPRPSGVNLRPGVAIDPIALGMARADVRHMLGVPPAAANDPDEFDEYPERGLEIEYDKDERASAIHVFSDVIAGYETLERQAFPLLGEREIRWGMSRARLLGMLGEPRASGDLAHAPIPTRWIEYPGVMYDFVVETDELFHVVVWSDRTPLEAVDDASRAP